MNKKRGGDRRYLERRHRKTNKLGESYGDW